LAIYREHVIAKGENVQLIATKELQDTSRWQEIVELNDLRYPYIVKTNSEKTQDYQHLVTYGDVIKLPEINNLYNIDLNTLDNKGKEIVYDMSMGMDISLAVNNKAGLDDKIAYLYPSQDKTDLATATGIDNLKESIQRRLLTRKGSLMYHPDYGTTMLDMVGEKLNPTLIDDLKIEIVRTIKTDKRVDKCEILEISVPDGKTFLCAVSITPIGMSEAFNMFIQNANGGRVRVE